VHDADGVAEAEEFRQVGADDHHGLARGGEGADELVDLGLAADVDTAGRLIEKEKPCVVA
jgi:hypothetical protein